VIFVFANPATEGRDMDIVYYLNYIMGIFFLTYENYRRGFAYFSINATTMIEDYIAGILLLAAAYCWKKNKKIAYGFMCGAWGCVTGGLFVPFAAHFEAWMRGATFRPDHPHTEVNVIIVKGVIWLICLICFIVSLRTDKRGLSR
jgi:hypothetical protein